MYETRCIRCGRKLTAAKSVERGYGRHCRKVLNDAALKVTQEFSRTQVEKAAEALRDGACAYVANGRYRFVSSDGSKVYWTTEHGCSCPAAEHGRKCYHRCTVKIRSLSPVR